MEHFFEALTEIDDCDTGLEAYKAEIASFHPMAEEEEYLLAKRYFVHRNGQDADRLVDSLLNLVVKQAESFRSSDLPMMEMIFAGNEGLMLAVRKFNPDRSYRLSGYASWWIRAAIKDYITRKRCS